MTHFNVKVIEVKEEIIEVPERWPDGKTTLAKKLQSFAVCRAKGKSIHAVPLMPEDEVPAVGARLKLYVPSAADGAGARPMLVERGESL